MIEAVIAHARDRLGFEIERGTGSRDDSFTIAQRDACVLACYRLVPQPSTRVLARAFAIAPSGITSAIRRALQRERELPEYRQLISYLRQVGMPWAGQLDPAQGGGGGEHGKG